MPSPPLPPQGHAKSEPVVQAPPCPPSKTELELKRNDWLTSPPSPAFDAGQPHIPPRLSIPSPPRMAHPYVVTTDAPDAAMPLPPRCGIGQPPHELGAPWPACKSHPISATSALDRTVTAFPVGPDP